MDKFGMTNSDIMIIEDVHGEQISSPKKSKDSGLGSTN